MIKSIIFDWKRTLYGPDNKTLLEGTKELLLFLKKKNIPLYLIGKGDDKIRQEVKKTRSG